VQGSSIKQFFKHDDQEGSRAQQTSAIKCIPAKYLTELFNLKRPIIYIQHKNYFLLSSANSFDLKFDDDDDDDKMLCKIF
jgi:hypothetical protein